MFFSDKERQYAGEEKDSKSWYVPCTVFCSAFLMYLIALLPIFVKRGLPFFYYGDYNVQQVPFYILAHRAVRSGELFWNWNVDLGGSMAGDFSFYLWGSPFFWMTLPFPEKAIPYLMPFLMALKYATAATCGYLYIRRYVKRYVYAMLGGFLYAFSGFNACNIVFNHFTDSVAFFPLYLLLFEELMACVDKGDEEGATLTAARCALIRFSLMTAFMAIVNYYFFFGQVVFLAIYFLIRYTRNASLALVVKRLNIAFCSGIIGVLLSGFFLIPAICGVTGNTRLKDMLTGYNMLIYPSEKMLWDIIKSFAMLPDIIGKGTLFYTSTVKNASLAAYIPMYGIAGVLAFFMTFKKKNWEKSIIITCLVMAMIPVLNAAFSLFNSSYYARWFYMPILIMCLMTAQVAERGNSVQLRKGTATAVVFFLIFVLVYLLPSENEAGEIVLFNMTDNDSIFIRDLIGTAILSILLLTTTYVFPLFLGKGKRRIRDSLILLTVMIACIISTYVPVKNGSSIISDRGKEKWQEQMLFNRVDVDMSRFSRGEVDSTSTNYDMVWGIPSIHCFLSTVPSEIFDYMEGALGITRTVETNIPVERAGAKTLVSGRYYFENEQISKNRVFNNDEGTPGYTFEDHQNGFDIFENRNFIPMGFTFDYYISESEWSDLDPEENDYDLVRTLILPDDLCIELDGKIAMKELTAEDLIANELTYSGFKDECDRRAATSCVKFDTDTLGCTARTAYIADDTLLFLSIPNTQGFSCKVDGKDTPIYTADYGLMAIPVSRGEHAIRLSYTPEGKLPGCIMSVAGILILSGIAGYSRVKHKTVV